MVANAALQANTQRWLARSVLGAGIAMILAMSFHPDGVTGDASEATVMRAVHGSLMFLIIVNAFAVHVFASKFQRQTWNTNFGVIAYNIGVLGLLLGTLVSGFVQTDLSEMSARGSMDLATFDTLNMFAAVLNQKLIQFGIVMFGFAGVVWAAPLIAGPSCDVPFGVVGSLLAAFLLIGPFVGGYVDVSFMIDLTIAVVIWHCAFAIWFLRRLEAAQPCEV